MWGGSKNSWAYITCEDEKKKRFVSLKSRGWLIYLDKAPSTWTEQPTRDTWMDFFFIPSGLSPETKIGFLSPTEGRVSAPNTPFETNVAGNARISNLRPKKIPVICFSQTWTCYSTSYSDLLNNTSRLFDFVSTLQTPWRCSSCYVAVPGFNHFWTVSTSCLKSETA